MHKFTHIEALHQVARYVEVTNENPDCPEIYKIRAPVKFRGTTKLHGTNAGARCVASELTLQSRSRVVTVDEDNSGFAKWMSAPGREAALHEIAADVRKQHGLPQGHDLTLYGEFIGPGIQKGTAVNALPDKQWVMFAVRDTGADLPEGASAAYLDFERGFADAHAAQGIHSIYDAPVHALEVDFNSRASKLAASELVDQLTAAVEARCPWGARFGVEGIGEGIVWIPLGEHWGRTELYFKTKGDKHKGTKRKQAPQIDPEVLENVTAFVQFALADTRLEQGLDSLREQGHSLEMKNLRFYLQWIGQDVKRECATDLEASGLEFKQVSRAITSKARAFFMARVRAL